MAFTSCLSKASWLARIERLETFKVYPRHVHSPTHMCDIWDFKNMSDLFKAPNMYMLIPSFSFAFLVSSCLPQLFLYIWAAVMLSNGYWLFLKIFQKYVQSEQVLWVGSNKQILWLWPSQELPGKSDNVKILHIQGIRTVQNPCCLFQCLLGCWVSLDTVVARLLSFKVPVRLGVTVMEISLIKMSLRSLCVHTGV